MNGQVMSGMDSGSNGDFGSYGWVSGGKHSCTAEEAGGVVGGQGVAFSGGGESSERTAHQVFALVDAFKEPVDESHTRHAVFHKSRTSMRILVHHSEIDKIFVGGGWRPRWKRREL